MFDLTHLIQSIGLIGVVAIVFAESGLLIGFFLPGDSLLFTAGFLASQQYLNIGVLWPLVAIASIAGVEVGYIFGQRYGRRLFHRADSRFFKRENLEQAQNFYEKHGAKTIVLARFVPIVRTFAPIVAGVALMPRRIFVIYNILGGLFWTALLTFGGYWLGERIPNVDRYILPIIALIIILSILPGILHLLRTPEQRRGLWQRARLFFRRPG